MTGRQKYVPVTAYFLFALVLLQALGGTGGGFRLVADPTGNLMGLALSLLEHTPFKNYLVPGLILFFVLGLFPLGLLYPLLKRPDWRWANRLNLYNDKQWAWTYSLYLGIMLILWIDFQILYIGYVDILQTVFAPVGVCITVVTLLPSVQRWYTIKTGGNEPLQSQNSH